MGYVFGFIIAIGLWIALIILFLSYKKGKHHLSGTSRSTDQKPIQKKPGLRIRKKPKSDISPPQEAPTPNEPQFNVTIKTKEEPPPQSPGADYSGQNLVMANLSYQNLRGANFRGSNMTMANLNGADLRDADLSYCNLTMANLNGADLRGAKMTGTKTIMANLSGVRR